MVKLFDLGFRHYAFEHGLRMLEKGYEAARDALVAEGERITAEKLAYEESVDNGAEWEEERDEEGHLLWTRSNAYDSDIEDTQHALNEVRKAFVIALYHHWEDSAARWKGPKGQKAKQYEHGDLVKYCEEMGYGPHPELEAVRCLTNHLKHGANSGKPWFELMQKASPQFLPRKTSAYLSLFDSDLYKIGTIILESGPTSRSHHETAS